MCHILHCVWHRRLSRQGQPSANVFVIARVWAGGSGQDCDLRRHRPWLLIANAIAIVYRIKSVVIVEGSNIEIDEMDSLRGYYFQQAICRSGIQSLKYNLGDLE